MLKSGVAPATEASICDGDTYTLDLTTVFEDQDPGSTLTYRVSVDEMEAVAADADYSYMPDTAGTHTLVFTANDGEVDSADTYTVTLTVDVNRRPARRDGVAEAVQATTAAGTAFVLNLTEVFEDEDPLIYFVSINESEAVAAEASYKLYARKPRKLYARVLRQTMERRIPRIHIL